MRIQAELSLYIYIYIYIYIYKRANFTKKYVYLLKSVFFSNTKKITKTLKFCTNDNFFVDIAYWLPIHRHK